MTNPVHILAAVMGSSLLTACDWPPSAADSNHNAVLACRLSAKVLDAKTQVRCDQAELKLERAKLKWTKKRLERAGWSTGDAKDFLELSEPEAAFIDMKLALAEDVRGLRLERRLNQTQVARILGSSQSRVAKMEAADASVSIDLLIRSLLKLGAERKDVARVVARKSVRATT